MDLPEASVAVQLTVVSPSLKESPELASQSAVMSPSTSSLAVTSKETGLPSAPHSQIDSFAGPLHGAVWPKRLAQSAERAPNYPRGGL